jgi:hypothetical protein
MSMSLPRALKMRQIFLRKRKRFAGCNLVPLELLKLSTFNL